MRANGVNHEIMIFTGFKMEELTSNKDYSKLLLDIDLVMDGPFIQKEKSLELKFRGSRNQRYWYKKDKYFICEDDPTLKVDLMELRNWCYSEE
jgi:hypothetical protein